MITGIGIDLADLERIDRVYARYGKKFISRILTEAEQLEMPAVSPVPYIGGRFAAKEAATKALGTGFIRGVSFLDIEVLNDAHGKPALRFRGGALACAKNLGVDQALVSITHERTMAAAVVILER